MDNKEIFRRNLNLYMEERQKSRKDVADAIGVSYFTFTDWARGKTYPRMDRVEELAKYFNIKISDLIEERGIGDDPIGVAEIHAEMLMDEDYRRLYEYYKKLNAKERTIVDDLVRNLAED